MDDFRPSDGLVKRAAAKVRVRTPRADEAVRVRGDWIWAGVMLLKLAGAYFLVDKAVSELLIGFWFEATLYGTASNKDGNFLWPVKHDIPTAGEAAKAASERWCRVTWDNRARLYRIEDPGEDCGEPKWDFNSFGELMDAGFARRVLRSPDDAVVQRLLAKR
jgi:hypothetical protein